MAQLITKNLKIGYNNHIVQKDLNLSALKRDLIDSLMAGWILSYMSIWEVTTVQKIVIAFGSSILCYMFMLFFKKEKTNEEEDR